MTDSYNVTAQELRQFIERIEALNGAKADIMADIKEVYAESKGRGYEAKIIRKLVAIRKRRADDLAEEEAILDVYKQALGMS